MPVISPTCFPGFLGACLMRCTRSGGPNSLKDESTSERASIDSWTSSSVILQIIYQPLSPAVNKSMEKARTQEQLVRPSCIFLEMVWALGRLVAGRWEGYAGLNSACEQHQNTLLAMISNVNNSDCDCIFSITSDAN